MSGRTGKRQTRKPTEPKRQEGVKTAGAFGKEGPDRVTSGESSRNRDKGAIRTRGGGA